MKSHLTALSLPCTLLILSLLLPVLLPAQELDGYQEAFVAHKSGRQEQALQLVDALLLKGPNPKALELKGRILHSLNNYKEAENFYFSALEQDPAMTSPHYHLGEAAFKRKAWSEAIQYYRVHINKVKESPDSRLKTVYSYLAAGNLPEAGRWITTLDPVDDFNPAYYFARAAMAFSNGKTQEYNETLQQARTIYGNEVFNSYEPDLLFLLKNLPKSESQAPPPAQKKP
ncbi:MAG: tetratricopeptide repeat protein [Blastochloris sp.]|nr:tetratricopeptide repeat protein [Blastochloris sp.]